MSESLPNRTVVAVWVSRKAANTQEYSAKPPSLPTVCGMAVAAVGAAVAAMNSASMTQTRIKGRRGLGGGVIDISLVLSLQDLAHSQFSCRGVVARRGERSPPGRATICRRLPSRGLDGSRTYCSL